MFKKLFNDFLGGDDENKKKEEEKLKAQQAASKGKDDEDEEEYDDEDDEDEDEDDDAYFGSQETDEERQQRILASVNPGVQLHPETLHGLHYTEADFDAEVERRIQASFEDAENKEDFENAKVAYRNGYITDVYKEWTGANDELAGQFTWANSLKYQGFSTSANVKEDLSNPLLAPIHGISFYDYSAMCSKMANGAKEEVIFKAFGIDKVIFEELNTMWPKRMQEDNTYTLVALMGQYYADADKHPKLQNLDSAKASGVTVNTDNIALLMEDNLFYAELAGAREAAYEYGLDGTQWILENYGIPLGDFQQAAMKHMQSHNALTNPRKMEELINYQNAFKEQYAEKFAADQGGNVADDIEF
jgi:hypothetical protein